MNALATYAESVYLVCPMEVKSSKQDISFYNEKFQFIPVPVVGGDSIHAKWKLVGTLPAWLKAFRQLKTADIIYQRFPNNLNIPGLFYFLHQKTFATYTGTWQNYSGEPASYRLQKWMLKNIFRGPVWVYEESSPLPERFYKAISPSYTMREWHAAADVIKSRVKRWMQKNYQPVFISVGGLVPIKNHYFTINVAAELVKAGFPFQLYIVGDGPLREELQTLIELKNLTGCVILTGHVNTDKLQQMYTDADFIIQSPKAEGFGKVPIEGFFYGLISFLSNTAMSEKFVGKEQERGFVFETDDPERLASFIRSLWQNPLALTPKMEAARQFATLFSIDTWATATVDSLLKFYD
jgi:glycosyltransferase involved in cell wall biosynthesis